MADIREKLTRLVLDAPKTDTVYGNIKLPKPVASKELGGGAAALAMTEADLVLHEGYR